MSNNITSNSIIPRISHNSACKVLDYLKPSELILVSRTNKFARQCIFYPVGNEHPKGANYRILICNRIAKIQNKVNAKSLRQLYKLRLTNFFGEPIPVPKKIDDYMNRQGAILISPLVERIIDISTESLINNPKLTLYFCVVQLKALNLPGFIESQQITQHSVSAYAPKMQRMIEEITQGAEFQRQMQQIITTGQGMLDESVANLAGIERSQRAAMHAVFSQIRSQHNS